MLRGHDIAICISLILESLFCWVFYARRPQSRYLFQACWDAGDRTWGFLYAKRILYCHAMATGQTCLYGREWGRNQYYAEVNKGTCLLSMLLIFWLIYDVSELKYSYLFETEYSYFGIWEEFQVCPRSRGMILDPGYNSFLWSPIWILGKQGCFWWNSFCDFEFVVRWRQNLFAGSGVERKRVRGSFLGFLSSSMHVLTYHQILVWHFCIKFSFSFCAKNACPDLDALI